MRVELAEDVFITDDHVMSVVEFLNLFMRETHVWIIDPDSIENIGDFLRKNLPTQADALIEFAIKASVVGQMWNVSDQTEVSVSAATIEDDLHDLRQPALLVVEDAVSDRHFIRAVAHVFDGGDIIRAIDEMRLDIRHGGGQDRAYLQARKARGHFRRTLRIGVFLDSDRMTPGETSKGHRLAKRLQEQGITVHVLTFREAENYVPNEVLRGALRPRDASRLLDHLTRLTAAQRAYFDMKHGFPARREGESRVPPAHRDLYDDVPDNVIDKLRTGFGTKLTELLEREAESGRLAERHFEDLGEGVAEELRSVLSTLRKII